MRAFTDRPPHHLPPENRASLWMPSPDEVSRDLFPCGKLLLPKNSILSPFPQNGLATKRDLTPRTGHREHWGKITSL
eukprot:s3513_g3.t1